MLGTSYLSEDYARSLSEFGTPLELPHSQGWVLTRQIEGTAYRDAMSPYPLFSCVNPAGLALDVAGLNPELASITLVTDPMVNFDKEMLLEAFPDLCIPFKEHYVIDFTKTSRATIKGHHRRSVLKAFDELEVEVIEDTDTFLDDWIRLHGHLVHRHNIQGIRRMSRDAFKRQFEIPGMVMISAKRRGIPVAAIMNFIQGDCAQAHILGCTQEGYRASALYAILWQTFEVFGDKVRYYNLMGVPGEGTKSGENIKSFKSGWTSETRTSYLCGRIINHERYNELSELKGTQQASYFPKYRQGEF